MLLNNNIIDHTGTSYLIDQRSTTAPIFGQSLSLCASRHGQLKHRGRPLGIYIQIQSSHRIVYVRLPPQWPSPLRPLVMYFR